MGRLIVITTSDIAPGFQLAGVEVITVDEAKEAESTLRDLLDRSEASLVVVRQSLLQAMSRRLQRRAETSYRPLVMAIPGGMPQTSAQERRRDVATMVRRAIGFQITFDFEEAEPGG